VNLEHVAENARRLYGPDAHVEVVPVLLDRMTAVSHRRSNGTATLCYAGRVSPEKNLDGLLRALHALKDVGRSWRLLVAGEGPLRDECRRLARQLGLDHRVSFLGRYGGWRELREIAGRVDAFVLPSKTEGFGLVLLEYAAFARPVIATPVGAATELVRDNETGFLAEGSEPDQIARAVERALTRVDQLPAMGRAARRLYENTYRPDKVFEQIRDCYERLLFLARQSPARRGRQQ